jgi:hypothetical protein
MGVVRAVGQSRRLGRNLSVFRVESGEPAVAVSSARGADIRSTINIAAVSDANNINNKFVINQREQHPIIPNTKSKPVLPLHSFDIRSRIRIERQHLQTIKDALPRVGINGPKITLRALPKYDFPTTSLWL